MNEKRNKNEDKRAKFIEHIVEKFVFAGEIVISLATTSEDGNSVETEDFVMRLRTAIELRNALNDLIDDQSAGMVET